jgi:hypothetical protein
MGPESGSHKVTITPRRWHVRRSSQPIDRSLTRLEAGGFSSQTVSTSASVTFSQGLFGRMWLIPGVPCGSPVRGADRACVRASRWYVDFQGWCERMNTVHDRKPGAIHG